MKTVDFMILAVVAAILIAAVLFIRREKQKGVQCIGCPDSGNCAGRCPGCTGNCCGCSQTACTTELPQQ